MGWSTRPAGLLPRSQARAPQAQMGRAVIIACEGRRRDPVGVHQAGEDHARQKRQVKPGPVASLSMPDGRETRRPTQKSRARRRFAAPPHGAF
jgi:hypothetical protein